MTFGMALELAPHNITVNCVAPGAIEGDRIDRVIEGQAKQRGMTPEAMRQAMLAALPSGAHGHRGRHLRRGCLSLQPGGAKHLGPGAAGQRGRAGRLARGQSASRVGVTHPYRR